MHTGSVLHRICRTGLPTVQECDATVDAIKYKCQAKKNLIKYQGSTSANSGFLLNTDLAKGQSGIIFIWFVLAYSTAVCTNW